MDWWLDGTDELQEGSWIFSNGERLTFTNWEPGQPDNGSEVASTVFAICPPNGKWHDTYCGHPLRFYLRMGLPVDTDPAARRTSEPKTAQERRGLRRSSLRPD